MPAMSAKRPGIYPVCEHLASDRTSHIFIHLHNSPQCRTPCSDECFSILDHASTTFQPKITKLSTFNWSNSHLIINFIMLILNFPSKCIHCSVTVVCFKTTVNIRKSYIWIADKDVNMKAIFAVMNTTLAVVKIRLEKIQACTGYEPMTSTFLMQCSTNQANKPTGS